MQTLVSLQERKWQGLGGEQDKNSLLGCLGRFSPLFLSAVLLQSALHFHTADILRNPINPLRGISLAVAMQPLWMHKAASPHHCDGSIRNSWALKSEGKRRGTVLLCSAGELWQRDLRAEYMNWQVEEQGWGENSNLAFQSLLRHVQWQKLCCQNGWCRGIINNVKVAYSPPALAMRSIML